MRVRLDFLIMHLLSKEEMYGFQIIKKISDICADTDVSLKTGTLYPLLATLEDKGYLSSRLILLSGRERKVYKATARGNEYLLQQKERWYKWESFANQILDL